MSLLEQNLHYLKEFDNVLYKETTTKLETILTDDGSVSLLHNKMGQLNIKVKDDIGEYFVHSNYNIQVEAERWASTVDCTAGVVVVLGLGLGYHIDALLNRVKIDTHVFIIEPDIRVFKCFLENIHISKILIKGNVTISLNSAREGIGMKIFESFKKRIFDKIDFKLYSGYSSRYGELFKSLQDNFSDIVNVLSVNIRTNQYFKELWIANFLMNIINMKGAYNGRFMKGMFKDIPSVIVSAGPSLEKNMEQLRQLKNKCIILAGGSAFTILKKKDISPHFAVAIDGSPLIKDIYEGIDVEGSPLIYLNRTYYELIEAYKEKKIVFIDSLDKLTRLFGEKMDVKFHEVQTDPTVAGINICLAAYMGCNPIILVGQDLACTGMKFHAEGAAHNIDYKENLNGVGNDIIKAVDIYGNETYTTASLLASKIAMESKTLDAANQGIEIINATEGGIGLANCKNMDLSEVISKYMSKPYDIDGILQNFYSQSEGLIDIDKEAYDSYFEELLAKAKDLENVVNELYEIVKEVKDILKANKFNEAKYIRLAPKINELQEQIEKNSFYKSYIVGSIEQTIAIHKIIMENEIGKSNDPKEKNIARVGFISKQCIEIIEFCSYIISFVNDIYKAIYKDKII